MFSPQAIDVGSHLALLGHADRLCRAFELPFGVKTGCPVEDGSRMDVNNGEPA